MSVLDLCDLHGTGVELGTDRTANDGAPARARVGGNGLTCSPAAPVPA